MANFDNTLFLALDLEFEQPSDEVLSIGVCMFFGNGQDSWSKNFYITPTEPVSTFIQELTGIREADFDDKPRAECYKVMSEWVLSCIEAGKSLGYKFHREAITWGTGDVPLLRADMRKEQCNFEWLSQRFIDVKTMFLLDKATSGKSFSSKTSLNTAMKELGVTAQGTAHNSMWDAVNTKEVFLKLMYKQMELKQGAIRLGEIAK